MEKPKSVEMLEATTLTHSPVNTIDAPPSRCSTSPDSSLPDAFPLSPFCVCAAELEFVQIVIIIVVMTVMVVVIICLLNHYKFSTWSFISRQSQARRHEHALQQVGHMSAFLSASL